MTITGAARTKALNIIGNAKANKIVGTSGNDTLTGAAGDDTLTGGAGSDVFIFDGKGKDVVTDYTAGEDTLKLTSTVGSYSISGSDATFKIGSGSVKVSGGKNKAITVVDSKNKISTYDGGLIYDGDIAKAKAVTVTASYGNTFASYGTSVVTIDSSARTKALNIIGNAAANVITGTSANDTINGGAGNDTLTGGKGKDIFIYESGGGNDVITDYTAGQDTIKISGSISSYSISGSDAIFKIDSGSLKVKGGKSSAITVVDANKNISTYQNGAIYNAASATKATAITLTSAYGSSFTAGTSAISVDASPRTAAINITGNTKNNYLAGGKGKDIIDGGAGNDSIAGGAGADILTGGKGNDVFIYANGDGGDVITDYVAGEDIIKLTSGEVKSYSVKNNDAIFKIGSGAVTLKGAGLSAISVLDADDVLTVYNGGLIYNDTKIAKADVVTITADYDGEFSSYGASVETIDAAARSKAIEITGNGADNFILGGKGKDTINGGKGSDTIIGGKGGDILTGGAGVDVFVYANGDGNDTIMDYTSGADIISLDGASLSGYSTKGSDAILKIGTASVTLKDAADAAVTIVGEGSTASIASGGKISTKNWTGISSGTGGDTVYVTETVEVEVTLPSVTETVEVEVTLPAVTLPAETVTVGGGETVTVNVTIPAVTLPAETVTVGGDTVTVTTTETVEVEVTLPAETITVGGGGGSLVTGTSGNDTLYGSGGNDTFTGAAGNDIFVYGGGFDIITDYGTGNDKISIGASSVSGGMVVGSDVVFAVGSGMLKLAGAKNKAVTIISGDTETEYVNSIATKTSNDTGSGTDTDTGTGGEDTIPAGFTTVILSSGNDKYINSETKQIIYALAGYDTISNTSVSNVVIYGGDDSDDIYNRYGNNVTIDGGEGYDEIYNYGSSVIIDGGADSDDIYNYGSSVTIDGGAGYDEIYNYGNYVSITGGNNNDSIYNYVTKGTVYQLSAGTDTIWGYNDNDTICIASSSYTTSKSGDNFVITSNIGSIILIHATNFPVAIKDSSGEVQVHNNNGTRVMTVDTLDAKIISTNSRATIQGSVAYDVIDNYGDNVSINSGLGNDSIYNHSGNNVNMTGGTGNDFIYNFSDSLNNDNGNNVKMEGGAGADTLYNYYGDSVSMHGGDDVDILYNQYGNNVMIDASDGDDSIRSYGNNVTIEGGDGIDTIYNSGDSVRIDAGDGDDSIGSYGNNVTIDGGEGIDTIYNSGDSIRIDAGDGDDSIGSYGNNVTIDGGIGDDYIGSGNVSGSSSLYSYYGSYASIFGGTGNDTIYNVASSVTIDGGADNDSIYSHGDSVKIDAGDGNDTIYSSGSSVTIECGAGNDSVYSNGNNVTINGGAGADIVSIYSSGYYASAGHNTIAGGTGNDTIYLNSRTTVGNIFQYITGDGNDVVYNLTSYDTLQISGSYTTQTSGSDVIVSVGSGSITLKDYSGTVNIQSASNGNAPVEWFTEDDTLTTGSDLDSLVETSIANSVSDLSMRGANSNELVNLEQPAITFSTDN